MKGDEDLGLKMRVGADKVSVEKKNPAKVNDKKPFAEGMKGDEDLGLKMRVGADNVSVEKKKLEEQKKKVVPSSLAKVKDEEGEEEKDDHHVNENIGNLKGGVSSVTDGKDMKIKKLGLDMVVGGDKVSVIKKTPVSNLASTQ